MDERLPTNLDFLRHRGDETHLFREIFRTYQVLIAGFERATGMTSSRFMLMRLLAGAERALGIAEMAGRLEIDRAAVTRLLQDLEREGLVSRFADAKDGRRSYVAPSAQGRAAFEQVHARIHELERALSTDLGEREMREAAVTLAKLRAVVGRTIAEGEVGRRPRESTTSDAPTGAGRGVSTG
jgi:DNA-binding MarR family transcriptional regulator